MQKKISYTNQIRTDVTVFITDKSDFKARNILWLKRGTEKVQSGQFSKET